MIGNYNHKSNSEIFLYKNHATNISPEHIDNRNKTTEMLLRNKPKAGTILAKVIFSGAPKLKDLKFNELEQKKNDILTPVKINSRISNTPCLPIKSDKHNVSPLYNIKRSSTSTNLVLKNNLYDKFDTKSKNELTTPKQPNNRYERPNELLARNIQNRLLNESSKMNKEIRNNSRPLKNFELRRSATVAKGWNFRRGDE